MTDLPPIWDPKNLVEFIVFGLGLQSGANNLPMRDVSQAAIAVGGFRAYVQLSAVKKDGST